jgi:threonine aldolase
MTERFFASDNAAPVHPAVMDAIARANAGHAVSYGDDRWTKEAVAALKRVFGRRSSIHFVYNGTGANVVGLQTAVAGYHGVICTDVSHLHTDECGAPERITGAKLLALPSRDGRMDPEGILRELHAKGIEHHSQPRIVSLTQSTELGTVYSPELVREIADICHRNDMYLHMDGARISNAAVALGTDLHAATGKLGVDILSLGGTKNGLMFGEAIVLFTSRLEPAMKYIRKQSMQLASKMRYIAVQFRTLFAGDLWMELGRQANDMARHLADRLAEVPGAEIVYPVEANAVFARLKPESIEPAQKKVFFYTWNAEQSVVRLMCSYDTTEADVAHLIDALRDAAT